MNTNFIKCISLSFLLYSQLNCTPPAPKNSIKLNNNVKIDEKYIKINGLNHFFRIVGEGEPILVLHGGPGFFSDYLIPSFSELKNYQLIFYDQRGSGKTDFPKDTTSITISNFVDDIEEVRKEFKLEKLTILGHSWGALLALNYAQKHPERLKRMILIAPAPSNSEYYEKTLARMQIKRSEEDTKELVRLMMSKKFEKRDSETFKKAIILGDVVNFYNQENTKAMYESVTFNESNSTKMLLTNSLLEHSFFDYDVTKNMDEVNCPTLIIIGDMDNIPFESAQLLQESIKNSSIEIINKTSHYPFFEDNAAFIKITEDFLTNKTSNKQE